MVEYRPEELRRASGEQLEVPGLAEAKSARHTLELLWRRRKEAAALMVALTTVLGGQ